MSKVYGHVRPGGEINDGSRSTARGRYICFTCRKYFVAHISPVLCEPPSGVPLTKREADFFIKVVKEKFGIYYLGLQQITLSSFLAGIDEYSRYYNHHNGHHHGVLPYGEPIPEDFTLETEADWDRSKSVVPARKL